MKRSGTTDLVEVGVEDGFPMKHGDFFGFLAEGYMRNAAHVLRRSLSMKNIGTIYGRTTILI